MNKLTPEAEKMLQDLSAIIEDNAEAGAFFRGAETALTDTALLAAQGLFTREQALSMIRDAFTDGQGSSASAYDYANHVLPSPPKTEV